MPYELIIEPSRGWWRLPVRDLLHYRDLLVLLVRRDFVAQYKQTVLGPLWFIIQPLLTTIVFTIIFGRVAKIPTDGQPPLIFYLCGLMVWNYFAGCFNTTSGTFIANAGIFGKVYFPRLVVPLAAVISKLVAFGIQLATFVAFLLYFKLFTFHSSIIHPSPWLMVLPLLLLHAAALALGVGLWITAMTTKYRDFTHLSAFLTQLWMYATPVVYPLSEVPARWQWLAAVNPMTVIVEACRRMFLGTGTVLPGHYALSLGITAVLLVSGLAMFNRAERTFIDTV